MKLLVGLGNPGPIHSKNLHNVGFILLDYIAQDFFPNLKFSENKKTKSLELKNSKTILAKPLTFMNNSGEAIALIKSFYKIPLENILIIHDDIDQPLGAFKIVNKGGSGGHRGVESIFNTLKTKEILRLKVGVAPDFYNPSIHKADDFVLKNLTKLDIKTLKELYLNELKPFISSFIK